MATNENMPQDQLNPLVEGIDYTVEQGRWVFTRAYHLKRGYCCGSGCRECPYRDAIPQTIADIDPDSRVEGDERLS